MDGKHATGRDVWERESVKTCVLFVLSVCVGRGWGRDVSRSVRTHTPTTSQPYTRFPRHSYTWNQSDCRSAPHRREK